MEATAPSQLSQHFGFNWVKTRHNHTKGQREREIKRKSKDELLFFR